MQPPLKLQRLILPAFNSDRPDGYGGFYKPDQPCLDRKYGSRQPCGWLQDLPKHCTGRHTTAPSVPTGLAATAVSTSQINLSWTASTDPDSPVAGYNIYRNSVQVGTSTGISYADTGLAVSTTYSYTVSAYDGSGNLSSQSSGVSATTLAPDTTAPSVPTGLTATPISGTRINLSWTSSTDPDSPVAGYNIYRNGMQTGSSITTSYSDTGLTASTTYSYTVTAYDAAGNESAQSTAASATTPAVVLAQIRQEYAIGYAEDIVADTEGFIHLDTGASDGSVSYYFEVTQLNPSTTTVSLRRKGTTIDDASITLDGVANDVQRSVAFTPPAGATDYVFHDGDIDGGDYMVRIVALQSNFTKTETQIQLDTDGNSTNPYSSTTFGIAFPHPAYWKYSAANWNGTKTFSWEIVWKTSSISAPATAQLQTSFDGISWGAVGSDVTTASTSATRTRTTFTPIDGNFYRIVVHSSSGSDSVTAFAYRIIVDQTDSPTKLEANYVVANSRWATTTKNDAATKWVHADWSGTTNIYEHRNVTEDAGTADVIGLYGMTDEANLTGSSNTADGTIMVTSGPVTMPAIDQNIRYNYTALGNSSFVDSRVLVLISIP
jgi:chitodextrinase